MEKVKEEMEETRAIMNASLNKKHVELGIIVDLVERSRRGSKAAMALSSRATSPNSRQGGARTLLASTSIKLRGLV